MFLPLLLAAAAAPQEGPDVVVRAPLPSVQQTPATMVVEPVAMLIATFDADGDARVTRAELEAGGRAAFAAFDPGGTGTMRYIAFGDWAARFLGDRHALPSPYEVDRNNDDQVTLDEMLNHFARLFARYDRDRDGVVTRAELITYRTQPVDEKGPVGGPPPGGRGAGGRPPRR
jgi:Ca2+-binding EF-hand superfamily protein